MYFKESKMSVIPVDIMTREEAMEWLLRHGYSVDVANEELKDWQAETAPVYDEDGEEYEEEAEELQEAPDIIVDAAIIPIVEDEEEEEYDEEEVCEDCECDPCECEEEYDEEDDEEYEEEEYDDDEDEDDGLPSSVER
jgi:hypothetical protein